MALAYYIHFSIYWTFFFFIASSKFSLFTFFSHSALHHPCLFIAHCYYQDIVIQQDFFSLLIWADVIKLAYLGVF